MMSCIISMAEISLWDKVLKEKRKHVHKSHAVWADAVVSTQRATTECFGRVPARQNFPLSRKLMGLKAIETTFAKNTHLARGACIKNPEF